MLDKLLGNTNRMSTIIEHLRNFARESKHEDIKPLDLRDALSKAYELLGVQLNLRSIEFEVSGDNKCHVLGDAYQLESIFQNLLTNSRDAFEDIGDDRRKKITVRFQTDHKRTVNVVYEDNAGGIPFDCQSKIFDPFFTTKPVGKGTGLGLSISLGIIKDHDGSIQAKSTPGAGTRFDIRLPYCEVEVKSQPKPDTKKVEKKRILKRSSPDFKPKVLLIDDEADICTILTKTLHGDFEVQSFTDSRKALNEIRRKTFDLIITDISMPFLNGTDIVKSTNKIQPKTPILLITGHDEEESFVKEAAALRISGILPKPFPDIDEMVSMLWDAIESSQDQID